MELATKKGTVIDKITWKCVVHRNKDVYLMVAVAGKIDFVNRIGKVVLH